MSSILQASQDFMFSTKILNASLKVTSPLSSYKVLRRYFLSTHIVVCFDVKIPNPFFLKFFLFMQIIKCGFFLDSFFNIVFHSTLLIYQHFSFFLEFWTFLHCLMNYFLSHNHDDHDHDNDYLASFIPNFFPLVDILNFVNNFLLFIY